MAQKRKPFGLPVRPDVGGLKGSGQDNAVWELLEPAAKPHLRVPTGWLVKVSHEPTAVNTLQRGRSTDPREAAIKGTQYKKNKYDLLRHFLDDFIPKSAFVVTEEGRGDKKRYVEMTLQKEVPQWRIDQLTDEQRKDPRLLSSVANLISRMQTMYSCIGEANGRASQHGQIDAKLDLGGVSDTVRSEDLDHKFTATQIQDVINVTKSPNLLVDPETMHLYCIDFDQGEWNPAMTATKEMAFKIADKKRTQVLGSSAVAMVQVQDSLFD